MKLRVGVAGCGRIATYFHLPILSRMADVELAALSDTDAGRRAQAARYGAAGVSLYDDAAALIADPSLGAVVLCVPPAEHAPLAVAAFAAGKHVYVEKPLALSVAEGAEVVAAWRDAGTVGMIGFNFRHHPAYRDLRRRLAAGALGEVIGVRMAFCSARRTLPEWKQAAASGGGALRDLGAHHLDLLPWLLGSPIRSVSMRARSIFTEADTAMLDTEMETGVSAQLLLSLSAGVSENQVEVVGSAGRTVADTSFASAGPVHRAGGRVTKWRRMGQAAWQNLQPRTLLAASPPEPSFAAALSAFTRAAAAGERDIAPTVEDGLNSLRAVGAAERSTETRRPEFIDARAPAPAHVPA